MKKTAWFLAALAVVCACQKDPETPDDSTQKAPIPEAPAEEAKLLFLLNEGAMGTNNASLDVLNVARGTYVTGAFKKQNPDAGAGLGDVGNDIAVVADEVWMVINNSGLVEVVSAQDQKEIAAIQVPTPRNLAFDDKYAYVTSWNGAYAKGSYDENYHYVVTDYKNPKGVVYRINLSTKKVDGSVEVGYQPEGIAFQDGKLYVANSGGISSQLAPNYAYDKTLSIIDTQSFTVTKTVDVQVNLKNVYADGKGNIYVTTLGNYADVHSGLYMLTADGSVKHVGDYVSMSTILDGTVYCVGAENEYDWAAASKIYKAWTAKEGLKADWNFTMDAAVPYGLFALNPETFFVADAVDYWNPGKLSCYYKGKKIWTVTVGVCPGHFAIW